MDDHTIKQEQEFLALLQKALRQAKENGGRISRDDIRELFSSFSLDEDQMGQIEAYLKAHKIAVGSAAGNGDDTLAKEEREFLEYYMESLKEIPKLSDQVMDAVRISAMAGERSAQRELTEQMLDKVVDIARLYSGQGISIEELIGTGNEALVTGVKLLGHLDSPREVDGELARRVMDSMEDLITVTMENNTRDREMEDLVNLVADKAKELSQILGRKVTPQELADEGDVTLDQIREALRLTGDGIESLDS